MEVSIVLILWLIEGLLVATTNAKHCIIGQEPDPASHHRLRWVIAEEDPCLCTHVHVGGRINRAPYRPFKVSYHDRFLHSSDPQEIRVFLNCPTAEMESPTTASNEGALSTQAECTNGQALGMEDGSIPAYRLTSSSVWKEMTPTRGRLNFADSPAAWSSDDSNDSSPWIQVEFPAWVQVTGVVTQGRADGEHWVETYQVKTSDQGINWQLVGQFSGNSNNGGQVTHQFSSVYTKFVRILPTACKGHCSMRFELLGCESYGPYFYEEKVVG